MNASLGQILVNVLGYDWDWTDYLHLLVGSNESSMR